MHTTVTLVAKGKLILVLKCQSCRKISRVDAGTRIKFVPRRPVLIFISRVLSLLGFFFWAQAVEEALRKDRDSPVDVTFFWNLSRNPEKHL